MYALCVFDLDGTLVNTISDIACAVNHTLQEMGYPPYDEAAFLHMVGNGMPKLCQRALPSAVRDDAGILAEMIERYAARYAAHCCDTSRPYPGIPELMQKLHRAGIRCAVISNKPHAQTRIVLQTLFPDTDFFYVEGQSERFAKKPDAAALLDCLARSGCPKQEAVYIGDSDVDIQFARNAGIDSIGAVWGFRGRRELAEAGATHLAETPDEVFSLVTG